MRPYEAGEFPLWIHSPSNIVNAVPSTAFQESRRQVLLGEMVKGQREETMREPDFCFAVLVSLWSLQHRSCVLLLKITHCCQSGAKPSWRLSEQVFQPASQELKFYIVNDSTAVSNTQGLYVTKQNPWTYINVKWEVESFCLRNINCHQL